MDQYGQCHLVKDLTLKTEHTHILLKMVWGCVFIHNLYLVVMTKLLDFRKLIGYIFLKVIYIIKNY